ncbi:MAG: hypothetical protein WAV25_02075 [Minisyncoccia bacterium]
MTKEVDFRLSRVDCDEEFKGRLKAQLFTEAEKVKNRAIIYRIFVSIGSLVAIFFVSISLFRGILSSGFYDYAMIVFYDFSTISLYLKEISLSLVESVPMLTLIVFVSLLGVFSWSARSVKRLGAFRYFNKQNAFN